MRREPLVQINCALLNKQNSSWNIYSNYNTVNTNKLIKYLLFFGSNVIFKGEKEHIAFFKLCTFVLWVKNTIVNELSFYK